jgi:hypothetical protein
MKTPPKLQVAADPRFVGGHPYHQNRYILTQGAKLVVDPPDSEEEEHVTLADNHGQIVATMTDCEHQKELAHIMAAGPDMLEAISRFLMFAWAGGDTSVHAETGVQPLFYDLMAAVDKAKGKK